MPTFEIDVNDANLPAYGPGRSLKGVCALTEFVVRTKPLNDPKVKAEPV